MVAATRLNLAEARSYVRRVGERWPIERAVLGGARVEDEQGAGTQRERGEEYVVLLVSQGFDGIPWLERVYQAESLWDGAEMEAPAEVHCYTPVEFERKLASLPIVRRVAETGIDLG